MATRRAVRPRFAKILCSLHKSVLQKILTLYSLITKLCTFPRMANI